MSDADTIRAHLEAIRDELRNAYADIPRSAAPLCRAYAHYEAALDLLDNSEECSLPALPVAAARAGLPIPGMRHRILPDPEGAS